jgi:hypothetical protein
MCDELTKYKNDGFVGFVKVSALRLSTNQLPDVGGVYVLVRTSNTNMHFLKVGTGGHFKGKNPNVDIETLESNVVPGSITMYIGKATSLRKRIGQLLRFGQGANVGHRGGRYLWQISDADDLLVAWKPTPTQDPRLVEASMLKDYINEYGKLPFANLVQ